MPRGFAILLGGQLLGEAAVRAWDWPIPGSVLGMLLLLAGLIVGVVRFEWVSEAAELLLSHMALLFVPVGVALMLYFELISSQWLPIVAATVGSTFVVLAVTALVSSALSGEGRKGGEGGE